MTEHKYMVGIQCMTYNQSSYIKETLDGFTMQQTTFPFIAMVVDDASTDGEQTVISTYVEEYFDIDNPEVSYHKETDYAHITYAQHKTNKNCYIIILNLKENLYSKRLSYKKLEYLFEWRSKIKYEALCEGDDYWIDPLKLQKQVDFLENNPDYGLVHTNFQTVPIKRINNNIPTNNEDEYLYEILNHQYRIATHTVLYRFGLFSSLPKYYITEKFRMTDFPLWVEFAKHSKIKYLDAVTAVYRICEDSASHSSNIENEIAFFENAWECSAFYIKKYNLKFSLNKRVFYIATMKSAFKHNNKGFANKLILNAFNEKCISLKLIVFYLGTCSYIARFFINQLYKY